MKKKLFLSSLAILMTASMVLGGCGNSKKTSKSEKEDNQQVNIKFTYWGSGDEKKAIEESVEKFMEVNPDIHVNLMHIPSEDFLKKLN